MCRVPAWRLAVALVLDRTVATRAHRIHKFKMIESDGEEEVCTICMDALENEYALPCGHRFHPWCLLATLRMNSGDLLCPLCRCCFREAPKSAHPLESVQTWLRAAVVFMSFFGIAISVLAVIVLIYALGGSPWNVFSYLYGAAALGWILPTRRNRVSITVLGAH